MKTEVGWPQGRSLGRPMSRRTFSRLFAGLLLAAPRMAIAQSSTVVRRIGRLESGGPDTPEDIRRAAEALREFG